MFTSETWMIQLTEVCRFRMINMQERWYRTPAQSVWPSSPWVAVVKIGWRQWAFSVRGARRQALSHWSNLWKSSQVREETAKSWQSLTWGWMVTGSSYHSHTGRRDGSSCGGKSQKQEPGVQEADRGCLLDDTKGPFRKVPWEAQRFSCRGRLRQYQQEPLPDTSSVPEGAPSQERIRRIQSTKSKTSWVFLDNRSQKQWVKFMSL